VIETNETRQTTSEKDKPMFMYTSRQSNYS